MIKLDGRHVSTVRIARYFSCDRLPAGLPQETAKLCHDLAEEVIKTLSDGPELTAGLRKLLEAKDCLVRAALESEDASAVPPS